MLTFEGGSKVRFAMCARTTRGHREKKKKSDKGKKTAKRRDSLFACIARVWDCSGLSRLTYIEDSSFRRSTAQWKLIDRRFLVPFSLSSSPTSPYLPMHPDDGTLEQPSSLWRFCSSVTMLQVAALCRGFLYGASKTEVHGQEAFLKLLESRRDHTSRTRGLITGNPL